MRRYMPYAVVTLRAAIAYSCYFARGACGVFDGYLRAMPLRASAILR